MSFSSISGISDNVSHWTAYESQNVHKVDTSPASTTFQTTVYRFSQSPLYILMVLENEKTNV